MEKKDCIPGTVILVGKEIVQTAEKDFLGVLLDRSFLAPSWLATENVFPIWALGGILIKKEIAFSRYEMKRILKIEIDYLNITRIASPFDKDELQNLHKYLQIFRRLTPNGKHLLCIAEELLFLMRYLDMLFAEKKSPDFAAKQKVLLHELREDLLSVFEEGIRPGLARLT